MKIEHFAMYVRDLESVRDFFVRFFGANASGMYHNPKTDFRSYFLSFSDGSRLEVMTRPGLTGGSGDPLRCGYIHLAFSVGGKERVDEMTRTLREAGYEVVGGPRTTGDGYYESSVLGPENNLIEITE